MGSVYKVDCQATTQSGSKTDEGISNTPSPASESSGFAFKLLKKELEDNHKDLNVLVERLTVRIDNLNTAIDFKKGADVRYQKAKTAEKDKKIMEPLAREVANSEKRLTEAKRLLDVRIAESDIITTISDTLVAKGNKFIKDNGDNSENVATIQRLINNVVEAMDKLKNILDVDKKGGGRHFRKSKKHRRRKISKTMKRRQSRSRRTRTRTRTR